MIICCWPGGHYLVPREGWIRPVWLLRPQIWPLAGDCWRSGRDHSEVKYLLPSPSLTHYYVCCAVSPVARCVTSLTVSTSLAPWLLTATPSHQSGSSPSYRSSSGSPPSSSSWGSSSSPWTRGTPSPARRFTAASPSSVSAPSGCTP